MIKIEKGMRIPHPQGRSSGPHAKYPIAELKVGDSFAVACGKDFPAKVMNRIYSSIRWVRLKNAHYRFTMRTVNENGIVKVRVWRLPDAAEQ